MRRAARMHVNDCAFSAGAGPSRTGTTTKTPGGASVIEMNVAEKNMAHILGLEADLAESSHHIVEGGFRTGIEKGKAVIGFKRGRGDDAGAAELVSVDDMDHYGRKKRRAFRAQRPTPKAFAFAKARTSQEGREVSLSNADLGRKISPFRG
jgi:hypothetical protein